MCEASEHCEGFEQCGESEHCKAPEYYKAPKHRNTLKSLNEESEKSYQNLATDEDLWSASNVAANRRYYRTLSSQIASGSKTSGTDRLSITAK